MYVHKLVQLRRSLERSPEARGRIKGRYSAECNLSYPQGQAGKPAYPLRRKALIFMLVFIFVFITQAWLSKRNQSAAAPRPGQNPKTDLQNRGLQTQFYS